MSKFVPWRPGDNPGPARFGLTQNEWRCVLELQARYATNSHGDIPEPLPPSGLLFLKHLVTTGRINEGDRHA